MIPLFAAMQNEDRRLKTPSIDTLGSFQIANVQITAITFPNKIETVFKIYFIYIWNSSIEAFRTDFFILYRICSLLYLQNILPNTIVAAR